jgi:hypothetical protein
MILMALSLREAQLMTSVSRKLAALAGGTELHDDTAGDPADAALATPAWSGAGTDSASLRQRSRVATEMLNSRLTCSTGALSGGNNRATALSLNACPYLATSVFHRRPCD